MKNKGQKQLSESEKKEEIIIKRYAYVMIGMFLSIALSVIIFLIYAGFKKTDISKNELETVYVHINSDLKWNYSHRGNGRVGRSKSTVIIKSTEYSRDFQISSYEFGALDDYDLEKDLKKGDLVGLLIKKTDKNDLNKHTLVFDYNNVYGIIKDGKNYISLDYRNQLAKADQKWAYYILIGLALLFIYFIYNDKNKRK